MPTNKRAKEIERQRLARQAARRREQQARQRRQALIAGGVVVLLVLGAVLGLSLTGGGHKHQLAAVTPSASPSPTVTATSAASLEDIGTPVCHYATSTQGRTARSPGLPPDRKATGKHTLTIKLTQGTIVVALNPQAPCTVNSFQWLASKHFFDNTTCPRVTTAGIYVLQCGDPLGNGTGGPGYTIPDENLAGAVYPAGTLAMANTGVLHSGGSQFFLVYRDSTASLGKSYTPFGRVVSGLDVLTRIAAAGTDNANGPGDGHPKHTVRIVSFVIS